MQPHSGEISVTKDEQTVETRLLVELPHAQWYKPNSGK